MGSLLHRGSLDQGKNIEYLMIDGFGTYYFIHCIGEFIPTGYVLKGLSCIYIFMQNLIIYNIKTSNIK